MEPVEGKIKITNQIHVYKEDDGVVIEAYGEGFRLSKRDAEKLCNAIDNITNDIADD